MFDTKNFYSHLENSGYLTKTVGTFTLMNKISHYDAFSDKNCENDSLSKFMEIISFFFLKLLLNILYSVKPCVNYKLTAKQTIETKFQRHQKALAKEHSIRSR